MHMKTNYTNIDDFMDDLEKEAVKRSGGKVMSKVLEDYKTLLTWYSDLYMREDELPEEIKDSYAIEKIKMLSAMSESDLRELIANTNSKNKIMAYQQQIIRNNSNGLSTYDGNVDEIIANLEARLAQLTQNNDNNEIV